MWLFFFFLTQYVSVKGNIRNAVYDCFPFTMVKSTETQDQLLNTEALLVLELSWESLSIADSVLIKGGCKLL